MLYYLIYRLEKVNKLFNIILLVVSKAISKEVVVVVKDSVFVAELLDKALNCLFKLKAAEEHYIY